MNFLQTEVSEDSFKGILSIKNAGKFLALFNLLFERLNPLTPYDPEKEKCINSFNCELFQHLHKVILDGRIEKEPPLFEEEFLKYGINLFNFIALKAENGVLENLESAFFSDINRIFFMLVVRKQVSSKIPEYFQKYLETLFRIYKK